MRILITADSRAEVADADIADIKSNHVVAAVDGRNPAPVGRCYLQCFMIPSQLLVPCYIPVLCLVYSMGGHAFGYAMVVSLIMSHESSLSCG